jgi:gamma-glutamyl:cysteine ligase YbdK (ATP-grasp superfamily)
VPTLEPGKPALFTGPAPGCTVEHTPHRNSLCVVVAIEEERQAHQGHNVLCRAQDGTTAPGRMTFRVYRRALVQENKWRAVRYGLEGMLIYFCKELELPARELCLELIEWFIGDVVDELGSRAEVEYAHRILREGSSADRQLRVYQESGGNLHAVVDALVRETAEGVVEPAGHFS